VVSRDEIKAAIVRTERLTDVRIGDPIGPRSFALFLRTIASFVDAGASVVAEQAFDRRLATDDLTPLARRTDARIVHCAPPTSVCDDRFRRRAVEDAPRRRAHPDGEVLSMLETGELDWSIWDAPLVEGAAVLRIDTSDGYDPSLAEIVAWCETSRPAP
jgi:hypothetical protein